MPRADYTWVVYQCTNATQMVYLKVYIFFVFNFVLISLCSIANVIETDSIHANLPPQRPRTKMLGFYHQLGIDLINVVLNIVFFNMLIFLYVNITKLFFWAQVLPTLFMP